MAQSSTSNIIDTVGNWFDKLPALPKDVKEVIVKITPWIALIFGVLGILGGIAGLGILTVFSPFAMMGGGAQALGGGMVAAILLLASSVLMLMAFSGLKNAKARGWTLLFWSEGISIIGAVLGVSLSGILFSLIAFYLLFQIRSHYK